MDKLITGLTSKGYNPYYINGDKYGKGNEKVPVGAYYKVIDEIIEQEENYELWLLIISFLRQELV